MAIPSLMQQSFTDAYDEFLFACSHGDYLSVERLLHDGTISRNDISTTMSQPKLSPIVVAIERNRIEVIKILLDYLQYTDFREALLLAIYLDLTKIAQLIMEHDTFKCFYGTFADWQTDTVNTYDESHFAAIRPIQLAAQYNRTRILYNFLKIVPHDISCNCNECKSAGLNDSLRYSQLRLSTYRGLSSDVYLALVSQDPIASAFELSNDLSKLIKDEPNYQKEYLYLFNQVSNFTARLLDHIQNQVELELLLTIKRLNSAIEHNQQEFIVHTNTQQRLTDLWYQNIDLVKSHILKEQIFACIYYFLIYIPMYIGYFWLPFCFEDRCRWYFQQPAIQALLHATTYTIFLLILILSGIHRSPKTTLKTEYPEIFDYCQRVLSMDELTTYYYRNIMTYFKIFALIFMVGYVYRNVRRMISQRRLLEILDVLLTILFILYIVLFTAAAIQVQLEWQSIINIDKWKRFEILHNDSQLLQNECMQMKDKFKNSLILFGRNQSAEVIDVPMVADGVYSIMLVCCIVHLCLLLLDNEYFGPLLVSLITLTKTIYRWFIFILIFICAYEISFLHLFSYYSEDKSFGADTYSYLNTTYTFINRARISRAFGNRTSATINVFFSLFGIAKHELTQTYSDTHGSNITNFTHYHLLNSFTSITGSFIYGSFAFFVRIILITMIIAYIKRVYSSNKQQVLNDWKFVRAKLRIRFIYKDPDILPVPLNLIPTPRHLIKFFRKKRPVKKLLRKNLSEKKFLRTLNFPSDEYNSHKKPTTDDVMNCIVLRFLTKYHPFSIHSLKRTRQIQYKEDLFNIRHSVLDEIQSIQEANRNLNKHISTVFFGLN